MWTGILAECSFCDLTTVSTVVLVEHARRFGFRLMSSTFIHQF